jgi:hypothetical protein
MAKVHLLIPYLGLIAITPVAAELISDQNRDFSSNLASLREILGVNNGTFRHPFSLEDRELPKSRQYSQWSNTWERWAQSPYSRSPG